ncbi:MAG: hypothetical protein J6J36_02940 [Clostridia bacterium]|nr:hypothetical protein [Clostridia bacterium]
MRKVVKEMRYKNIICKYCGEPATVSTLRKADYCDKESCKALAHNEASRICYKKSVSNPKFNAEKITAQRVTNRQVSTEAVDSMEINDIKELARELGNLRYRMIKLIQKEVAKEKKFNKTNDIILHTIEFEKLTDKDWENIKQRLINDRKERRGTKIRRQILNEMLANLTMKNPGRFVEVAVDGAKKTRHFDECLADLREDESLFAKKKDGEKKE